MPIMELNVSINRATEQDPRGLIAESYHIDNISVEEARSIFLDWAITDAGENPQEMMQVLLTRFEGEFPAHPMTVLLREGVSKTAGARPRRGRLRK